MTREPRAGSRPSRFTIHDSRLMSRTIGAFLVLAAIAAAAAPLRPATVERWYSTRMYSSIQRTLTPATNLLPVSVLDLLMILAAIVLGVTLVRAVRASWRL